MVVNKRVSLLALTILMTFLAAALIAALTFGGGAKRTVASRSAAAFREAQRKGEPGAKAQPEHGGHGSSEMKKPEHAEQGSGGMTGHDMSGRGMPTSSPSAAAHAGHVPEGGLGSPRGREGQREEPAGGHAGMQHGTAAAAGRPRGPMAGAPVVPPPGPKAAEASPSQPAGTLRPDPLDQPAETSVADARRSSEMSREMGGGHGMQGMRHGMSSYRQLDAGRDSVTSGQEERSPAPPASTRPDHGSMQHGSPPPSKPTPGPPRPDPTHPPHHSGGSEESPRHGEAAR